MDFPGIGDVPGVVAGPVVALLGVWLGGYLASRAQGRAWERERETRSLDVRRAAYASFLTAVKHLSSYAKDPRSKIEVVAYPGQDFPITLTDEQGLPYRNALEASSAELLLLAQSPEPIDRARRLRAALMRCVAARATYPAGSVPAELMDDLRVAEEEFVNAARLDLNVPALPAILWPNIEPETTTGAKSRG